MLWKMGLDFSLPEEKIASMERTKGSNNIVALDWDCSYPCNLIFFQYSSREYNTEMNAEIVNLCCKNYMDWIT